MSIDIITTHYRNIEKFKICLETVTERTKFVDYKWYIWANDPDDKSKQVIDEAMYLDGILFNDHIEPIFNDTNDGSFSSNNNAAAKEGTGEYILFMNDDIEPINEDWLLNMSRILDSDPKVGVVGAMLVYPDRKTIQHCGVFFSHRTNNLPFHMFYKQPIEKAGDFINHPRYYQVVTAACMLVRRADFEAVGGFDENYFYMYEDVDLCLKFKQQLGKYCVYCPQAQLVHHEGISGTFTQHPKLQQNIDVFRSKWTGKYLNDYDFYMQNPNHMIYKYKVLPVNQEDEEGVTDKEQV